MRPGGTRPLVLVIGLLASGTARADNFFEADFGAAIPVGDDDYDRNVDNSLKLGVRLGTATKFGGIDLSVDFTPYSDDLSSDLLDVSVQRYRFMVGGRYVHPINPKTRFYVRAAGGLDLIHYNAKADIINLDQSETDAGIALQVDTGVLFDLGRVAIGARLGIPIGFHFNDDDPNDPNDTDLSYTGVDIDFAFTLAVPF